MALCPALPPRSTRPHYLSMGSLEEHALLPPGYKEGDIRPFVTSDISRSLVNQSKWKPLDRVFLAGITTVALLARFNRLPYPQRVVFDETHFGGYAKDYFSGEFFVDVHPPLVKLIFYWIAVLFKWDGEFEFLQIGDVYNDSVPYVAMRGFSALCGVGLVALTYISLRATGCRPIIALFGAALVTLENSLATISRLIMLDSALLAFIGMSVFTYTKFENTKTFSKSWFQYAFLSGISIGFVISSKASGLFTWIWIGFWSLYHVWAYIGDLTRTAKAIFLNILVRLVFFVGLPLTIYTGLFAVNFMALSRNGKGSGQMSPAFKSSFVDSDRLLNYAVDVSYGSVITLRHHRLDMYLHSHPYPYKTGSHEQQVTMYGFDRDVSNEWIIETKGSSFEGKYDRNFKAVKDGDTIKLRHKGTGHYLNVNDVRPPNSEHDYSREVSCTGNRTNTDKLEYEWKVEIIGKKPHSENDLPLRKLRATESVFRLKNRGYRCSLMGNQVKLPDWAFFQNQVLCMTDPTLSNTLWFIEMNRHPVIDGDAEKYPRVKLPQLLLFRKMFEYHHAVFRLNKSYTSEHDYASSAWLWPFVKRGINFFSNGKGIVRMIDESPSHIYALGNVAVYYGGLVVLVLFGFKFGFYLFDQLNPFKLATQDEENNQFQLSCLKFATGWFINYFPYFQMSRQLFMHHYLPSLFFLVLLIAQYSDHQLRKRPAATKLIMVGFLNAAAYIFIRFSPLIYGLTWTVEQCQQSRWLSSWDYDCSTYGPI